MGARRGHGTVLTANVVWLYSAVSLPHNSGFMELGFESFLKKWIELKSFVLF